MDEHGRILLPYPMASVISQALKTVAPENVFIYGY
jgi:hypothetical protein